MRRYLGYMSLIMAAIFISVLASPMTASAKVKWFGYIQSTAEFGDGLMGAETDEDNGLRFGADRVRIGYKAKLGKAFSKLQVDFNKTGTNVAPNIIKDAEVGYKFDDAAKVKVGIFKTPVGLDFNTSGKKLDITKRGMEKQLVLERTYGLMLSGRKIGGGFGYDIGVFNPTTRSSVVDGGTPGDQMAFAGRIMYDMGSTLHVEASLGSSEEASGVAGSEDYTVFDFGVIYRIAKATLKAEYISGTDLKGVVGADQTVWYFHAGYQITPMYEAIIRHYQGDEDATDTKLGNTFLGLNVFLNPAKKFNSRIQLNYVFASGDEWDWAGVGGYPDNTFLAQYQVAF